MIKKYGLFIAIAILAILTFLLKHEISDANATTVHFDFMYFLLKLNNFSLLLYYIGYCILIFLKSPVHTTYAYLQLFFMVVIFFMNVFFVVHSILYIAMVCNGIAAIIFFVNIFWSLKHLKSS
ncbi:hypothetical protein ACG2LH_16720 [Zhouia sp. PK063]|uniref:hypothetical protein n=1 Tax=Zhouia sp. PK063 TaxID=3373602 RepID=UPI00378F9E9C